jgi:hypothetical protein
MSGGGPSGPIPRKSSPRSMTSRTVGRRRSCGGTPGSQRGTEGVPPEAVAVALSKLAGDRGQDRDAG